MLSFKSASLAGMAMVESRTFAHDRCSICCRTVLLLLPNSSYSLISTHRDKVTERDFAKYANLNLPEP